MINEQKIKRLLKDEDLMRLVKEYKYAHTGEDKIEIGIFANHNALKKYNSLSFQEVDELEKHV